MRNRMAMLALAVMAVATGGLVVQAVAGGPGPVSSSNFEDDAEPSTQTPSPQPPDNPAVAATGQELLWGQGALLGWSYRGTCSETGQARLDISVDGGTNFEEVALPLTDEESPDSRIRTILAVELESADELIVVGNDADCQERIFQTEDGGVSWESIDQFDGWYVGASGTEVWLGDRFADGNCSGLRAAPLADSPGNGKLLCEGGTIQGTNDAGLEWVILGELSGAADMSFSNLGSGFALAPAEDCAAAVYETGDAGGTWNQRGCAAEDGVPRSLLVSGDQLTVLVDGEIYSSDNGGESWSRPGDDSE